MPGGPHTVSCTGFCRPRTPTNTAEHAFVRTSQHLCDQRAGSPGWRSTPPLWRRVAIFPCMGENHVHAWGSRGRGAAHRYVYVQHGLPLRHCHRQNYDRIAHHRNRQVIIGRTLQTSYSSTTTLHISIQLLHLASPDTMLRARTPLLVVAFAPALLVISIGLIYLRTTCRMQLPTAQVLNSGLEGLPGLMHMWAQHATNHDEASALAQLAADLDEAISRFKSGEAIHPLPAKVQPAATTSSGTPCTSAGSGSTLQAQVQSLAISGLQCHIAWNIDYWGDPLVWGDTHLTDTAADCCAACHAHQQAAARGGLDQGTNSTACNTWSHCSDKDKCGDRYRQCWLKHLPALPPPDGQGTPSVFSSGLVYDSSDAWLAPYDSKTRLTLRFQMGEVEVELLPDLAPASVRELRRLAALLEGGSGGDGSGGGGGGGCDGCQLYRVETNFLVQGVIRHPGGYVETPRHPNPPQKKVMERGLVCWAGGAGGPDFFVNLVDQPGFGDSHLCWGKVHDMALLDDVVQLPTWSKEKPDEMTFLQDFLPFNMSLS